MSQPLEPASETFLIEVWREACQHIDLSDAVARIVPHLSGALPLARLIVREVDLSQTAIETLAAAPREEALAQPDSRSEITARELETILAWCHSAALEHDEASVLRRRLPGLVPARAQGDVLAGPLAIRGEPAGALVLIAPPGESFEREHEALARSLLEPFSAALENDRRLRSLAAVREAAQADRAALLSRLGRKELGESIVGGEGGLAPVMDRVGLVAPLDVPVLVVGETGSGKEVVARAIHTRSRRASGPFLRVNCGAIPPGLIDSELFGHERGSFTGALAERRGWFERADRGTLFLDEIGELPLEAQVRLLRVLQDHTLERVGGHRPISVDVRIVAATHRDLRAMIAEGRFREDLWYRIAVFPIDLPPLRERAEDVPALANHFALRAATRFGTAPRLPSRDDLALLVAYPWPGNVRELIAVIERAVILGSGAKLDVEKALGVAPAAPAAPLAAAGADDPDAGQAFATLDQAIARHIEAALTRTRGKIEGRGGAAEMLGVNPHTLRARMRKLAVDWQRFRSA